MTLKISETEILIAIEENCSYFSFHNIYDSPSTKSYRSSNSFSSIRSNLKTIFTTLLPQAVLTPSFSQNEMGNVKKHYYKNGIRRLATKQNNLEIEVVK